MVVAPLYTRRIHHRAIDLRFNASDLVLDTRVVGNVSLKSYTLGNRHIAGQVSGNTVAHAGVGVNGSELPSAWGEFETNVFRTPVSNETITANCLSPNGLYVFVSSRYTSGGTGGLSSASIRTERYSLAAPFDFSEITHTQGLQILHSYETNPIVCNKITADGLNYYVLHDDNKLARLPFSTPFFDNHSWPSIEPVDLSEFGTAVAFDVTEDGHTLIVAATGTPKLVTFNLETPFALYSMASPVAMPLPTAPNSVYITPSRRHVYVGTAAQTLVYDVVR